MIWKKKRRSRREGETPNTVIGDVLDPFHESIARYLERQIAAGKVRHDVQAGAFAELFTATLMGGMLRRTSHLSGLDSGGWLRETVELFARGIEKPA